MTVFDGFANELIFFPPSEANPFANLWNSQANNAPQTNENPFAFNSMSMPIHTMPPMSFPPMPPMIFTPPPTIPSNLDQLTDEELHQLEGNERENITERLKVWTAKMPFQSSIHNVNWACSYNY